MSQQQPRIRVWRGRLLRAAMGTCAWVAVAIGAIGAGAPGLAAAAGTEIDGLRMSATEARSRLVFELDAPVTHSIFTLSDPDRVVIDIEDAHLAQPLPERAPRSRLIERIRSAPRNGNDLRVVLDTSQAVRPKSFVLKPAGQYGHRLVVDVSPASGAGNRLAKSDSEAGGASPPRDLVIAIDPGHGGKDPGASGYRGTKEKNVVLQVARRLRDLLAHTSGYKPFMTRDKDVFLSLRDRIRRAREAKADMFISIHADAFRDRRARGSSVYALSTNGASSEAAKWLADQENSADLIGGVSLDDKDKMVASVLLDLSQTATIESSLNVGKQVLDEIGDVNRLHKHSVQQAGFVVLKSPDIPSILVETAFISNPNEERRLNTAQHQHQLATAIRDGIKEYFERQAPPGTRIYAQNQASSS